MSTRLTERTILEILEHEAIVCEAYKDSKGIWTWGVGVTDASGHTVARYKDKPVAIKRCLEVYEWLLREKYLPDVLEAFEGYNLPEHQLAAALSFHYNTGAIKRAGWVKSVKAGNLVEAYDQFMQWSKPLEIIGRRKAERELFFHRKWLSDGKIVTYSVKKPSYQPDFRSAKTIDVRPQLREICDATA